MKTLKNPRHGEPNGFRSYVATTRRARIARDRILFLAALAPAIGMGLALLAECLR